MMAAAVVATPRPQLFPLSPLNFAYNGGEAGFDIYLVYAQMMEEARTFESMKSTLEDSKFNEDDSKMYQSNHSTMDNSCIKKKTNHLVMEEVRMQSNMESTVKSKNPFTRGSKSPRSGSKASSQEFKAKRSWKGSMLFWKKGGTKRGLMRTLSMVTPSKPPKWRSNSTPSSSSASAFHSAPVNFNTYENSLYEYENMYGVEEAMYGGDYSPTRRKSKPLSWSHIAAALSPSHSSRHRAPPDFPYVQLPNSLSNPIHVT